MGPVNFLRTLIVTVTLVLAFGTNVLTLGLTDLVGRRRRLKRGSFGPFSEWTKLHWGRLILQGNGVSIKASGPGLKTLKTQRGAVIVVNHQSLLDIPVLFQYCPPNAAFVAKRELMHIPIFGWAANVVGTIFINRSKGAQNESLQNVVDFLKAGVNVVIFPEGTRSSTGNLGAFKRGAFVFAIQAKAPIIPITILNSRKLLPKHQMGIKPGQIEIIVDEPVPTNGLQLEDRKTLSEKIRGIIEHRLKG